MASDQTPQSAADNAILVLLNDHPLANEALEKVAEKLRDRGGTLSVATQGDNVARAMALLTMWRKNADAAANAANPIYVSHMYERKRCPGAEAAAKKRFYGPNDCKLNTYDFVFTSSGCDSNRRIGHGEDQIVPEKGHLPLVDALTDHVYSSTPVCVVSFEEEQPAIVQRDYHCIVLDAQTAETLVETGPKKPDAPPSGSRRARRFATAVRTAPVKVLSKNRKAFVDYCMMDKSVRERERLEIPPPLARIIGSARPDFSRKEAAYFKRLLSIRKASGDLKRITSSGGKAPVARTNGIHKKRPVNPAMARFLVEKCGLKESDEGFSRVEISKALPKYIKENKLAQGKYISFDKTLKTLLGTPDYNVTYFSLQKLISPQFA